MSNTMETIIHTGVEDLSIEELARLAADPVRTMVRWGEFDADALAGVDLGIINVTKEYNALVTRGACAICQNPNPDEIWQMCPGSGCLGCEKCHETPSDYVAEVGGRSGRVPSRRCRVRGCTAVHFKLSPAPAPWRNLALEAQIRKARETNAHMQDALAADGQQQCGRTTAALTAREADVKEREESLEQTLSESAAVATAALAVKANAEAALETTSMELSSTKFELEVTKQDLETAKAQVLEQAAAAAPALRANGCRDGKKRKRDCTPEEWAAHTAKIKRGKAQRAADAATLAKVPSLYATIAALREICHEANLEIDEEDLTFRVDGTLAAAGCARDQAGMETGDEEE